jgi:hypothetical protein
VSPGTLEKTKSPVSFDCVSNVVPRVSLINVMVAPGITAPCASRMLPAIVADCCADANDAIASVKTATAVTPTHLLVLLIMVPPDLKACATGTAPTRIFL